LLAALVDLFALHCSFQRQPHVICSQQGNNNSGSARPMALIRDQAESQYLLVLGMVFTHTSYLNQRLHSSQL